MNAKLHWRYFLFIPYAHRYLNDWLKGTLCDVAVLAYLVTPCLTRSEPKHIAHPQWQVDCWTRSIDANRNSRAKRVAFKHFYKSVSKHTSHYLGASKLRTSKSRKAHKQQTIKLLIISTMTTRNDRSTVWLILSVWIQRMTSLCKTQFGLFQDF